MTDNEKELFDALVAAMTALAYYTFDIKEGRLDRCCEATELALPLVRKYKGERHA